MPNLRSSILRDMVRLDILCGPIASGKSSYCSHAVEEAALIVNDDDLVLAIHGGVHGLYSKDLKPLYKAVENTIIQVGLTMGRWVIVDRPNYSRAMRRRYIGLAKSLDVSVRVVMLPRESPETHARRRANTAGRNYSYDDWLEVAREHEALYEVPCQSEEGFDELTEVAILKCKI